MAESIVELLRCPETHQSVAFASADVVKRIEGLRAAGELRNRGGLPVDALVEGCLIRADGAVYFPIRDGIPIMLVEESIAFR